MCWDASRILGTKILSVAFTTNVFSGLLLDFPYCSWWFFSYNFTFSILKDIKIIIIFVFACHVLKCFGVLNAKCFPESWPISLLLFGWGLGDVVLVEEACYWGIVSRVNGLTHFQFVLSLCFVFAIEDVVFSLAAPATMPVTCGHAFYSTVMDSELWVQVNCLFLKLPLVMELCKSNKYGGFFFPWPLSSVPPCELTLDTRMLCE